MHNQYSLREEYKNIATAHPVTKHHRACKRGIILQKYYFSDMVIVAVQIQNTRSQLLFRSVHDVALLSTSQWGGMI